MRRHSSRSTGRRLSRAASVALAALLMAACGGGAASPTAPSAPVPSQNAPPVVKSVTVDRHHIDAGDTVSLVAAVEDAESDPAGLEYLWTVQPPTGTFAVNGPTARWTSPVASVVPATYTFSVTVVERYSGTDPAGRPTSLEHRVTGTSPSIIVNDARRETKAHADAFLQEFSNATVSPEMCTRNFTTSCDGRQAAVQAIADHRAAYADVATAFELQVFLRSVEWPNCTAANGTARCAVLIYHVERVGTRRADGIRERTIGEQQIRAVYEDNRWWLCDQRFTPSSTVVQ